MHSHGKCVCADGGGNSNISLDGWMDGEGGGGGGGHS